MPVSLAWNTTAAKPLDDSQLLAHASDRRARKVTTSSVRHAWGTDRKGTLATARRNSCLNEDDTYVVNIGLSSNLSFDRYRYAHS